MNKILELYILIYGQEIIKYCKSGANCSRCKAGIVNSDFGFLCSNNARDNLFVEYKVKWGDSDGWRAFFEQYYFDLQQKYLRKKEVKQLTKKER